MLVVSVALFKNSVFYILVKITALATAVLVIPRIGELRTQKLNSHLVRTQSLNVFYLKPGVSKYIAVHATPTARDFFLAYIQKPLPISPVLAVANTWFLCRPVE